MRDMTEITTHNPFTEEIIRSYLTMDKHEINEIIETMNQVQKKWMHTNVQQRKEIFLNSAKLLRAESQQYAELITTEMGKPIKQALAEIEKCAKLFDYYAQQGEKFLLPELIKTEFHKSYRSFHPLGIIFAIMPWNFPFWQVMRFAVPNLMLGNAALLKHAPNSTGTALAIENFFEKAGFPKGLFRSLVIDVDLAPYVIQHPKVEGITLTGSNKAGKSVAKEAGAVLKKVVLELGGSDPYVILEDANLELAAEQCVTSRLNNAGQVCIAAKRIIVVDKIKNEFESLVMQKAKTYNMGNPLDPNVNLGPMARRDLRDHVHEQVQRSIAMGANCVLGGHLPNAKGFFYPATILLNITQDSPAFHEEIFGPVICISGAANEQQALELANDSEFGLAAAIFTRDLKKGDAIARDYLEAGTCAVNVLVATDPRLPFGGIKQSGYGRELSREGMHEFANIKTVIVSE